MPVQLKYTLPYIYASTAQVCSPICQYSSSMTSHMPVQLKYTLPYASTAQVYIPSHMPVQLNYALPYASTAQLCPPICQYSSSMPSHMPVQLKHALLYASTAQACPPINLVAHRVETPTKLLLPLH